MLSKGQLLQLLLASAEGAKELSPALQRWVNVIPDVRPVGTARKLDLSCLRHSGSTTCLPSAEARCWLLVASCYLGNLPLSHSSSFCTGSRTPKKNWPKTAYTALTSSKRISYISFLKTSGSGANRSTPHSQSSKPME